MSNPWGKLPRPFDSNYETQRVPVKMDFYKGLPHVFWGFNCPAPSGDFVGDVISGVNSFLCTTT